VGEPRVGWMQRSSEGPFPTQRHWDSGGILDNRCQDTVPARSGRWKSRAGDCKSCPLARRQI